MTDKRSAQLEARGGCENDKRLWEVILDPVVVAAVSLFESLRYCFDGIFHSIYFVYTRVSLYVPSPLVDSARCHRCVSRVDTADSVTNISLIPAAAFTIINWEYLMETERTSCLFFQ